MSMRTQAKSRAAPPSRTVERASRLTLKRLIERKIDTLGVADLRRLANELNVLGSGESDGTVERPAPSPKAAGRLKPDSAPVRPAREIAGRGIGELLTVEQGGADLDAMTVEDGATDWAQSELLGAGEMAARLRVSRATLDNWRVASKVIAFRKGVRNYVYPVRQFERFGPVEGLDRVLAHFANAEDAWEWLVTPSRVTHGDAPLDRLRAGHLAEVERAAEGALDYA